MMKALFLMGGVLVSASGFADDSWPQFFGMNLDEASSHIQALRAQDAATTQRLFDKAKDAASLASLVSDLPEIERAHITAFVSSLGTFNQVLCRHHDMMDDLHAMMNFKKKDQEVGVVWGIAWDKFEKTLRRPAQLVPDAQSKLAGILSSGGPREKIALTTYRGLMNSNSVPTFNLLLASAKDYRPIACLAESSVRLAEPTSAPAVAAPPMMAAPPSMAPAMPVSESPASTPTIASAGAREPSQAGAGSAIATWGSRYFGGNYGPAGAAAFDGLIKAMASKNVSLESALSSLHTLYTRAPQGMVSKDQIIRAVPEKVQSDFAHFLKKIDSL